MKHFLYFSMLVVLLFLSCSGKKNGKSMFSSTSSGNAYELLVVIDLQMWERPAGRALNDVLKTDVPGLPQSEASFRVMFTDPSNFDATLKLIRNIVIVNVSDIYTQPKMTYEYDVYAYPQAILNIQAPDEKSFGEYVIKHREAIVNFFTRAEMNRQIKTLEENYNNYVYTEVQKMFGCEVWVPGALSSHKVGDHFFWAGTNTATGDQNFVMYSFPYTDPKTFTKEFFLHKRDSVMKINIPGAREGMYMATDTMFTSVKPIAVQGKYALEARGLWRIKGDFMGGPFVSHMRLDTVNQQIVVSEAFVYSPDKMKRNLIRQMEASLYTVRLPRAAARDTIKIEIEVEKENDGNQ